MVEKRICSFFFCWQRTPPLLNTVTSYFLALRISFSLSLLIQESWNVNPFTSFSYSVILPVLLPSSDQPSCLRVNQTRLLQRWHFQIWVCESEQIFVWPWLAYAEFVSAAIKGAPHQLWVCEKVWFVQAYCLCLSINCKIMCFDFCMWGEETWLLSYKLSKILFCWKF